MMSLLLLSLGIGAIPAFLEGHVLERPGWADDDANSTSVVDGSADDRAVREPSAITIGYIADAARNFPTAPVVVAERQRLSELGYRLVDIRLTGSSPDRIASALDRVDAVYLAGGSTFALLAALVESGARELVAERVRAGLPYIGLSAGAVVAGPSIEPASLMDDPADAAGLTELTGLALTDIVVVPHADGKLPPYPPELIAATIASYGGDHHLAPVRDDQALLIRDGLRILPSA
jgi:dipeptidase E